MRSVIIPMIMVAITAMVGFFGFSGIVAPIAKGALLLIPTIFTICLVIGFASRRQNWFR